MFRDIRLRAVCLLLFGTAIAAPAPPDENLLARVEAVNTNTMTTITITATTSSTLTDATGVAAANDQGKGESTVCHNTDGDFKPFCQPKHNEVFFPYTTHYGKPALHPPSPPLLPARPPLTVPQQ
jgi:hypothetical protein